MTPADEVFQVSAALHYWQTYDPSVKSDLFSAALQTSGGLLLVDPIPLQPKLFQTLTSGRTIAGVFVTNANHCRIAVELAAKFGTPIFAHRDTCAACESSAAREVEPGEKFLSDATAIEIEGAAAGEMVIHHGADGGALIVGDALINFEPYGFTFLPPKYCSNAKQMRRSLHQLLDYDFERMLFAHGTPLIHSARQRLETLLQSKD